MYSGTTGKEQMNENPQPGFALVTGGAHRVGRILALELAKQGYDLIIHYHTSVQAAIETAAEIRNLGRQVVCISADLRELEEIKRLFESVGKLEKPLRILVNSAAVMPSGRLVDASASDWQEVMDTNLRAPLFCTRAAAEVMPHNSLVINICDEFAHQTWKKQPLYGLSKSTLEQMTKILANEFRPGLRVNGLALGPVLPSPDMPAAVWERIVERSAVKKANTIDLIGQALAYLIKNEYISGEILTLQNF